MACSILILTSYLEEVTQGLAKSLHFAATNAFPRQSMTLTYVAEPHKIVGMIKNAVIY